MAKDANNSSDYNSFINQDDTEKSLVGKFKSIISNTPLSKWFRRHEDIKSTIRRRDETEEAEQLQPPAKRPKFAVNENDHVDTLPIKTTDNIKDNLINNRNYNIFPEPVAGPSGLQSRKLLNNVSTPVNSDINVQLFASDFLNGHKDSDSEESTSGYSSVPRIGSKERVCQSEGSSKQPSPLQTNSPNRRCLFDTPTTSPANRSLFVDRTAVSSQLNASMSSRRPQFTASTFGSPNFVDQTLSTEKVINSPFYNGSTMYGGASAYGQKFGRRAKDFRASLKRQVHIRPIKKNSEGSSLVLGKTARKILETLEQYSTPVNDAKKIPVASKRVRLDTSLLGQHVGFRPYLVSSEQASNKELQVPTVTELLKIKQKAKLQSSTEAVRQIATSSKSSLNTVQFVHLPTVNTPKELVADNKCEETTSVNNPKRTTLGSNAKEVMSSNNLKEATSDNSKEGTSTDKSKELKKNNRVIEHTRADQQKRSPCLPLSTTPLTQFSPPPIMSKLPSPSVKVPSMQQNVALGNAKKNSQKELPLNLNQFKFSDPLVIAENLKSIVAINNFKFSEPSSNMIKSDVSKPFKEKNNGQTFVKEIIPNSSLLEKFKPAVGTWECSTCLIRNQPEKTKCAACETPKVKPLPKDSNKSTFDDKFKMPTNMWECPLCMIRNKNDSVKCAACETPNPKPTVVVSSSSSFQGKFQPPANTWECSVCLIRNKEETQKCAACETPRVKKEQQFNKLVSSFNMKADEWECEVCMVRNKDTHSKCQCCEADKPGSLKLAVQEPQKKLMPKFNFGIDKDAVTQFKFGIQPSTNTVSTAPILPEPVTTEIKTSSTMAPSTFSFGVPPNLQKNTEKVEPVLLSENKNESSVSVFEKTEAISTLKKDDKTPTILTEIKDAKAAELSAIVTTSSSKSTLSFTFGKPKDVSKIENLPASKTLVGGNSTQLPATPSFSFTVPAKPGTIASTTGNLFGQSKPTIISANNGVDVKPASTFDIPTKPVSVTAVDDSSTKTSNTKLFSFTKADSSGEPAAKMPMFNFGQSARQAVSAATTQSSGFNVGQVAKSNVFNFGGKTDSASLSGNAFNTPGTSGAPYNVVFNFGSGGNQNNQKVGFNFGASPAVPSSINLADPPTTVQPASSSGFNFSASFDGTTKPSFNFTDGSVTSFSAQPPGDVETRRKVKKAVRRNQR